MNTGGINSFVVAGIIATFLWAGFVCAISFMEAWLKFTAPGVSLSIGLGIGRIVFRALNIVEWILAIVILINMVRQRELGLAEALPLICVFMLILQTVWLLPALDDRAELIVQGQLPDASLLHYYYVVAEVIKVVCLFVYGIKLIVSTGINTRSLT